MMKVIKAALLELSAVLLIVLALDFAYSVDGWRHIVLAGITLGLGFSLWRWCQEAFEEEEEPIKTITLSMEEVESNPELSEAFRVINEYGDSKEGGR